MFDLESAIATWRNEMLAVGVQSPAPLDELETHLRTEVEHQHQSGSSLEQAFANATQEIGTPESIQKEYRKLGRSNSQKLIAFKPYAIVISFVLAMFFTSLEIISQILAFIMFVAAYEIEIRILRWLELRGESPTRQLGIALASGAGLVAMILQSSEISLVTHLSRTMHQNGQSIVDNWSQPTWYALMLFGLFLIGIVLAALPKKPSQFGGLRKE